VLPAAPSAGFELFGIRLWGEDEEDGRVEVLDPLPYSVAFSVSGEDDDLEAALRGASSLWGDRNEPAAGRAGLLAKAKGDYRRLLGALYTAGYYGGEISITLDGREAAELSLAAPLPPQVNVAVRVDPGPLFRFGATNISDAPPWERPGGPDGLNPVDIGFLPGEPAEATAVTAAEDIAVERWRQRGRAKAQVAEREVVADHPRRRLDVSIDIEHGRVAYYGPVMVQGSRRVDAAFIEYMTDLEEGERFDSRDLESARQRLSDLGVFRLVRIEEAEEIEPDGRLPMTVQVEDRRPRTIGVGASISSIDGLGLEAYWMHRNLLGRAEQLRVEGSVVGLGGVDVTDYTYRLGVSFLKPGVIDPDTSFIASLFAERPDYETYTQESITGRVGLSRSFGNDVTGELSFQVSKIWVQDDLGDREFFTVGPYARLVNDRRDDPLEPTRGYYLAGDVTPFYEFEYGNAVVRGTVEGRAYRGFGAERRIVLAGRALVGSFVGASNEESPPSQLFFAGGGGSVRGYAFRSLGVEFIDADGDEIVLGGKSLVETSAELRARIGERFGLVGFVDTGLVGADSTPDFDPDDWLLGVGLGVRYYTRLGPLRLDVAVPLDERQADQSFGIYIGIGQAF
jgi:translocation and assembly module TamA